jgi:serine/threonine protein kinase
VPAFFILRKLAEGPATEVFLVHLGGAPERRVAEMLRTELTDHAELVGRFEGEAELRIRDAGSGMLPWVEVGRSPEGRPYLLSAPLPKETLRTRLLKRGPLPLADALDLGLGVVRALLPRGVVPYGKLSPEWILLEKTEGGAPVKLLDLGLTLSPVAHARLPAWLPPEYRAPEVLRGEPLTVAADVFGIGLILYEALTGASPARGLTPEETIRRQLEREVPRLPERVAVLGPLVARCLAKNPAERFASLAELE